ncbi:hypothetical protein [Geminisphaera colitermitum]|uniref:hypothetical protein n=1 Tax=Geminisphaera colitermitum TaxID=1148786 RepID=UPI0012FE9702|nr:hypothetical protein [Geminisphaera colitermitum]
MPRPAYAGFASEAPTRGAGVSPAGNAEPRLGKAVGVTIRHITPRRTCTRAGATHFTLADELSSESIQ